MKHGVHQSESVLSRLRSIRAFASGYVLDRVAVCAHMPGEFFSKQCVIPNDALSIIHTRKGGIILLRLSGGLYQSQGGFHDEGSQNSKQYKEENEA